MIEFVPLIVQILVLLAIGLVAIICFIQHGKFGFVLISIGFFFLAVPGIVSLALGGPHFVIRLHDWDYTPEQIGLLN